MATNDEVISPEVLDSTPTRLPNATRQNATNVSAQMPKRSSYSFRTIRLLRTNILKMIPTAKR
ncbi:MAG: hypothetical protein CM15mP120_10180 [Pseudomonadota bacterium]|nr:MAG: hypothetical protein CM15mP120_10180 [Pseudomonadota bacterium]